MTHPAKRTIDAAEVETSPLQAAVAALLDTRTPEAFATVCDALAGVADGVADAAHFHHAVDHAENLAMASGILRTVGQDGVQAIMAQSFRRCRVRERFAEPPPRVCALAAGSTIEALMYSLRERDAAALLDQACRNRLAALSSDQIHDVIARLIALRPRYPNITDELLFRLGEQL